MGKSYWIWYPGDMELYYGMKQNFSRVERGFGWPAFWKSEGFRNRVAFRRTYQLKQETKFTVISDATGFVLVNDRKYPFGQEVICSAGEAVIAVHAGCIEEFPSIYIQGEVICSDEGWMVEDYDKPLVRVGFSKYFTSPTQRPSHWEYAEKTYMPVHIEECNGGLLCEFETELTAQIEVKFTDEKKEVRVYCGESREEALDREHCYYSWLTDPDTGRCPRCAVRFAFLDGVKASEVQVRALHQYVDIPVKAEFSCSDEKLNSIWKVAEHTFRLCSGIFFIDGIKRDKWIWSGDAYQSLFVNQYLLADKDINRRTWLALRGNDPMTTHINTIVDYTLFWILGVQVHYEAYADRAFLEQVYPKMCSTMEFCEKQLDDYGFIVGREKDWIYIDWADLDKDGPLCAEQMLLAKCWKVMAEMSRVLGFSDESYMGKYQALTAQIQKRFWDEEKGAYIDSFTSGKRHVTRHANIFALLFGIAEEEKQTSIIENVLENPEIPQITTPYFQFYELEALCQAGHLEEVLEKIKGYWGGMLDRGAVTFWEEFDPEAPVEEQYDMYGDRFGKSLCHAWGASPIYLLGRYFMGIRPLCPGGERFEVKPHLEFFENLDCRFPIADGTVRIKWDGKNLEVTADVPGGVLCLPDGSQVPLQEA